MNAIIQPPAGGPPGPTPDDLTLVERIECKTLVGREWQLPVEIADIPEALLPRVLAAFEAACLPSIAEEWVPVRVALAAGWPNTYRQMDDKQTAGHLAFVRKCLQDIPADLVLRALGDLANNGNFAPSIHEMRTASNKLFVERMIKRAMTEDRMHQRGPGEAYVRRHSRDLHRRVCPNAARADDAAAKQAREEEERRLDAQRVECVKMFERRQAEGDA